MECIFKLSLEGLECSYYDETQNIVRHHYNCSSVKQTVRKMEAASKRKKSSSRFHDVTSQKIEIALEMTLKFFHYNFI